MFTFKNIKVLPSLGLSVNPLTDPTQIVELSTADRRITNQPIKVHPYHNYSIIEYTLKFDGCSKGNPGPAGAGAVIYKNGEEVWGGSIFLGNNQTNNYAEYSGLILGLKRAQVMGIKDIHVYGDSDLVIKQMTGTYKVKSPSLFTVYTSAKDLACQFDNIQFTHIYRNENKKADELANLALIFTPEKEDACVA